MVSLVNFDNQKRVSYLERSFGSFHSQYQSQSLRHLVFDGSKSIGNQREAYRKFNCEVFHQPGMPFGARLRWATREVKSDYFLFLPDDFAWIFPFPLEDVIGQCREYGVDELKLTARGMSWYSESNPQPQGWQSDGRVISGEQLVREGDLFVSKRHLFKDFHEQFSLACNLFRTSFAKWVFDRIPEDVLSAGQAEKRAYLRLIFKRYKIAYYRMWIPAFHFIDLNVEGDNPKNRLKLRTSLIESNYEIYNKHFNR